MEDREALRVASKLQEVGGALRIQGRELPGHGAAWVHRDSAQKVFMRWLLVSRVERGALHRAHPLAQAARKQCGPGSWPSIYLYSPTSWRDCPKRVQATLRSWIWLV